MAALRPLGRSTTFGTGSLSLITPQHLSTTANRAAYCKHDDGPYSFVSSLNYTFPDTPSLSPSDLASVGFPYDPDDPDTHPFDCFLELPTGAVVFEIKGEISSHLSLVFEVWVSVLFFNYKIGVYSCDLLDLDKDPCAFNIDQKYIKGQGGLFPKDDENPDLEDLCLELHVTVQIPYTRKKKPINFEECFYKFPKSDD